MSITWPASTAFTSAATARTASSADASSSIPRSDSASPCRRGFRLFNGQAQVSAIGPDKARIIFDRAGKPSRASMVGYLRNVWAPSLSLAAVSHIDVNGLDGATGTAQANTQSGTFDLRLVAIRFDADTIYRFLFVTPPALTGQLAREFQRTTYSFQRMSEREAAAAEPLSVRLKAVEPGETVESLARGMPFEDFHVERFRALNGMRPGQSLRVGQLVKIVDD